MWSGLTRGQFPFMGLRADIKYFKLCETLFTETLDPLLDDYHFLLVYDHLNIF